MHNIVIAKDILIKAAHMAAPGKKISRIKVRIGEMAIVGHEPEDVQAAFSEISRGTQFEGAELSINIVKIKAVCGSCGKEQGIGGADLTCSKCGSPDLRVAPDEELIIEKMD